MAVTAVVAVVAVEEAEFALEVVAAVVLEVA